MSVAIFDSTDEAADKARDEYKAPALANSKYETGQKRQKLEESSVPAPPNNF